MIYHGDCLDIMPTLADKSVDMILCDLPYGTTACKWDTVIPFEPLWAQYKRLIKNNGAIVLTASQPFTSALVMSNPAMFKYCWYWEKSKGANFAMTGFQPLKVIEDILVFSFSACTYTKNGNGMKYFPQKVLLEKPYTRSFLNNKRDSPSSPLRNSKLDEIHYTHSSPRNLLYAGTDGDGRVHPTQKPVALFEYLIRTYTNEGDTVLDNCAGSGTTGVACLNTNRKFILIEKDPTYCEIIRNRIANHDPLFANSTP